MAGHSKWNNIKNKKAATDAKRAKVFAMLSKQIIVSVKEGGSGDPDRNPRLRVVMDKAREENMPKANIQKAIDKGLGKGGGNNVEEILYEGFGPSGVGFLVKSLTDNRNRTGSEIKFIFDKHNGSLGGPNSVSYMFERTNDGKYTVKVPVPVADKKDKEQVEKLVEVLQDHDDVEYVVTNLA